MNLRRFTISPGPLTPEHIDALETALPDDGGSPYICPECSQRLKDIKGYWGCLCRDREQRDGRDPAG